MAKEKKKINLVLEGGGMKGLAFIGALMELEKEFEWAYLAGTSAGALVATLLAFGKTSSELLVLVDDDEFYKNIKRNTDFVSHIPIIGPLWNIFRKKGLYDGDWIESVIRKEISSGTKKFVSFNDLNPPNRLTLMATDITEKRSLAFPEDWVKWGQDYGSLDVAFAARCSMSIPGFFMPKQLRVPANGGPVHYFMDGGMLSNFPYWYLETMIPDSRQYPTIGLVLDEKNKAAELPIRGLVDMVKAALATMLSPLDQRNYEDPNFENRIININVKGVNALDFDINREKRDQLFFNGRDEALKFMSKFNYDSAVAKGNPISKIRPDKVLLDKNIDHLSKINVKVQEKIQQHTFDGSDKKFQLIRSQFALETMLILDKGLDDAAAELIWTAGVQAYNGFLSIEFDPTLADQHIDELNSLSDFLHSLVEQDADEGYKDKANNYISICIGNMRSSIRHRANL